MDGIKNMIIQLNMVLRKHAGYLDPLAADPETNQAALQNYLQKNFGSLDAQVGKVNDTIDAFSGQDFGMFGNKYKKNIQNMAAQFGQFYNNVTEAGKTLINNPTAFVESLKALLPFIQQSANNIDAVKQEAEQTVAQQAATQQAATPSNETADALRNMDRNQNGTPDNQEAAPPVPVDPNGQPVQQKPLNDVINTVNQVLSPKGIQQMSPDNKAQWAEMFKGWLKQLEGTYSK
jgi:methyl-accepting chemotaxis protein